MPKHKTDFITLARIYSEIYESPQMFFVWGALAAIAAAAQRKLWMSHGLYTICPNIYLVIVGQPGQVKKSTAINMVEDLLRELPEVATLKDVFTKEALTKAMAAAVKPETITPIFTMMHSSMTLFANELSALLKDKFFVPVLNSLYDCKKTFDSTTKWKGVDNIPHPFLNIIAATTPKWVADSLGGDVIEAGFTSRALFIYQDTPARRNPFPIHQKEQIDAFNAMVQILETVLTLKGEFQLTPAAADLYRQWYNSRPNFSGDFSMAGFYERKPTHVLKVAMMISLAHKTELVIEEQDIQEALALLDAVEPLMERAFKGVGKNPLVSESVNVLDIVRKADFIEADVLFKMVWHNVRQKDFIEIIEYGIKGGTLEKVVDVGKAKVWIGWKGSEKWNAFRKTFGAA